MRKVMEQTKMKPENVYNETRLFLQWNQKMFTMKQKMSTMKPENVYNETRKYSDCLLKKGILV